MMQTCLGRGERAAEHEATEHGRVAVLAFAEPDPNLHEVIPGERSGNGDTVSRLSSACASRPRGSAHALTATVADASRRADFHAAAARLCAAVTQPPGLVRRDAFAASCPTFSVARVGLPQRFRRNAQRRAAAAAAGTTEEDTARATRVGGAGVRVFPLS